MIISVVIAVASANYIPPGYGYGSNPGYGYGGYQPPTYGYQPPSYGYGYRGY